MFSLVRLLAWAYPCVCSLYDGCYWISQTLQQLKSGGFGDSSRKIQLQWRWRFCKLGAKKQRDLQVIARPGIGNNTISTNFDGVLLL